MWRLARRRFNLASTSRRRAPTAVLGARMLRYGSTNRSGRLRRECRSSPDVPFSSRRFLCVACRTSCIICSCCDRGNIYCAGDCARAARRQARIEAGRRYQTSRSGRLNHAARARRYRTRQKKVTHHGSPATADDGPMPPASTQSAETDASPAGLLPGSTERCDWCGHACLPFVRLGFIRRRERRRGRG